MHNKHRKGTQKRSTKAANPPPLTPHHLQDRALDPIRASPPNLQSMVCVR
jgi:hypothetical protein